MNSNVTSPSSPGLNAVLKALPHARLVGGCVRDTLAARPIADIDLATPDPPEDVIKALAAAGLRSIPTGLAHGTVTALAHGESFEITTLRRDVETDGRHAVVAFTDDWREDASRRDFTINAMSMTPDGHVFDYFGGIDDLKAGLVRFVGHAATRIAEDYLRILRYFRFYARYGTAGPDAEALTAITNAVPGLAGLSGERVWSELQRILAAHTPDSSLKLMAETGVLTAILPQALLAPVNDLPADPILRLAALLPPGLPNLKFSGAEAERLLAVQGPPPPNDATEDDLRRALADTSFDILIGRVWLAGGNEALRARIAAIPEPIFPVQGRDLQALGVQPGPEMGQKLRHLRKIWLESGCHLSREDLLNL